MQPSPDQVRQMAQTCSNHINDELKNHGVKLSTRGHVQVSQAAFTRCMEDFAEKRFPDTQTIGLRVAEEMLKAILASDESKDHYTQAIPEETA